MALTANMIMTAVIGLGLYWSARSGTSCFPGIEPASRKGKPLAYWGTMSAWSGIFIMGCWYSWLDIQRGYEPLIEPMGKMVIDWAPTK